MAEIRFEGQNLKIELIGTEEFLEEKGQKIIADLVALDAETNRQEKEVMEETGEAKQEEILAQYLKPFNGKPEKLRFLAIAAFLQNNGMNRLETGDIIKALKKSNQKPFANTSDCKAKCIKEGSCAKDDRRTFYVTNLGFEMLKLNSSY